MLWSSILDGIQDWRTILGKLLTQIMKTLYSWKQEDINIKMCMEHVRNSNVYLCHTSECLWLRQCRLLLFLSHGNRSFPGIKSILYTSIPAWTSERPGNGTRQWTGLREDLRKGEALFVHFPPSNIYDSGTYIRCSSHITLCLNRTRNLLAL